ncbi:hypothetical protein P3H15_28030 [Rhodococcus sp. T2V]|jgi:hypothetical protein|uniref:hypothetical protein n=1 Tax=Rhodococcus sp. T2V TaxID=3034164 RepID=UPI0023E267EC|nr:hypothetical protein [Rhodococcus sp. T2V]MDF3308871.1 hypothetical protein [Rhodococcus sp. T2V]
MILWQMSCGIAVAGAVGGVAAALMSEDRGFVLPKKVTEASGTIVRPGFIALVVIGAVAGLLSWGLYGPLANAGLFEEVDSSWLTLSAIAGAALVGTGGSKWLSGHVDKTLLQQAASAAARSNPASDADVEKIATGTPMEALDAATSIASPAADGV